MRLYDNVALAVRRLRHRPWRSFLLLQGTIWGVAVALLQPAVFLGTQRAVVERPSAIGADRLTIASDPTAVENRPLVAADAARIRDAITAAGVKVKASAGVRVFRGGTPPPGVEAPIDWIFGPPEAPAARGIEFAAGRPSDPEAPILELVVEGRLASELSRVAGKGDDPAGALGTTIVAPEGTRGTVVGVLRPRDPVARRLNDMGMDTGHSVFKSMAGQLMLSLGVPLGDDGWKRTDRCVYAEPTSDEVDWIFVRVAPTDLRVAAKAAERASLAVGKSTVRFYSIVGPMLLAKDFDRFKSVPLALFLACLAMGAVVMAHVGLLSAMRRAGEIALHRAEGATQRDILVQFLAEGGVLSMLGALLGWGIGCGLAELRVQLEPMAAVAWAFPWSEAWIALSVSVIVGVLACVVPARRAAGLDPAEALCDE